MATLRLDITAEICPLTFVKTKLLIEKMSSGELLEVRLRGIEPLRNVPRSVKELGHDIVSLLPENEEETNGTYILTIKKC